MYYKELVCSEMLSQSSAIQSYYTFRALIKNNPIVAAQKVLLILIAGKMLDPYAVILLSFCITHTTVHIHLLRYDQGVVEESVL